MQCDWRQAAKALYHSPFCWMCMRSKQRARLKMLPLPKTIEEGSVRLFPPLTFRKADSQNHSAVPTRPARRFQRLFYVCCISDAYRRLRRRYPALLKITLESGFSSKTASLLKLVFFNKSFSKRLLLIREKGSERRSW